MAQTDTGEFFIYVPGIHDAETSTDPTAQDASELDGSSEFDPEHDAWVKILLGEQVIVYARLDNEQT